jgi:hypothetical protein
LLIITVKKAVSSRPVIVVRVRGHVIIVAKGGEGLVVVERRKRRQGAA